MKKFLMIAAMAMFATVACEDKNKGGEVDPTAPDVTIVSSPASVEVNGTGKLTATLSKAAEGDVTIAVANANAAALTVGTEIKIAKGATSASIDFTGKAIGDATLSFTSSTANVKTISIKITVKEGGDKPIPGLKDYCEPEFPDFKAYAYLDGVVIGSVTLPAGEGNDYFDFAHEGKNNVTIAEGMNVVIKFANIDSGAADPYGAGVYIDWNNDGDFKDAGEVVGKKEFKAGAAGATQDITIPISSIPADAKFPTTMRILSTLADTDLGNAVPVDGCGLVESGTAYDVAVSK